MSDPADTETPESILSDILSRSGSPPPEASAAAPVVTEREAAPEPEKPSDAALALSRIAALDAELAAMRKERQAAQAPPEKARRTSVTADDLRYDPTGALAELGISDEVLAQFLVAKHAGPNAPVDFRVQAALMPQLGALQKSVRDDVSSLRSKLEDYEAREADRALQDSMHKALSGISSDKYPTLARALAADRDGTTADLIKAAKESRGAAGGTPESSISDALAKSEAFYAALAKRLAPAAPATSTNGSTQKQANKPTSAPPATMANLSGPPPGKPPDGSYEEQLAKLREEILARA